MTTDVTINAHCSSDIQVIVDISEENPLLLAGGNLQSVEKHILQNNESITVYISGSQLVRVFETEKNPDY